MRRPPTVRTLRSAAAAIWAASLALASASPAAAQLMSTPVSARASTPELIDRAQGRGAIGLERANLLRVYALKGDPRLPVAYESTAPWRGTTVIRQLDRSLRRMDAGPEREAVAEALLAPPDPNATTCSTSATVLPNSLETEHFYIQYNSAGVGGGLTAQHYADSLEDAWNTEVVAFRWAAPPASARAQSELGGKYHVRIDALGPGLYGFVSPGGTYAGFVGDNPNSSWNDQDAEASCMVLNQDFDTGFPGTPQQALDATTAHEFNHSLQFGYGALDFGPHEPDINFIEGGATWMEDEVQDAANDNYNYLYPAFDDSMGEHEGDEYAYWLTFRGITERFGANTPGGSEQVMQDFWELISREESVMLAAFNSALANKSRTLAGTFHDYAIAARLMQTCGGANVRPYCFEEASGYSAAQGGPPPSHGTATTSTPYSGSIEDDYTINWVDLPADGAYDVTLANTSGGGQLRATIACSTASGVAIAPFPAVAGPGVETTVPGFNSDSCPGTPVAAITNQSQTAANPDSSASRSYSVSASTAPAATDATVPAPVAEEAPDNGPDPTGGGSTGGSTGGTTGGGATTSTADVVKPVLSSLTLSRRRFRAARSGRAITATPVGMRVRYRLSERATLTVRYERRTIGRRVGGRCRAKTRRNRRRAKCVRWVLLSGSARRAGQAGSNSFRLTGRWRGRALKPARYRLRLSARDGAKNVSATRRSASFRIVRR